MSYIQGFINVMIASYGRVIVVLGGMVLIVSACSTVNTEQTLIAQDKIVSSQVVSLAITNTVERARLQTTLDYANTRVSVVGTQSQLLKATLVGRGTAISDLDEFQATMMQEVLAITPSPTPDTRADSMSIPLPTLIETPTDTVMIPTAPIVTLNAPGINIPPTNSPPSTSVASTKPTVQNILLGDAVGEDDCIYAPQQTFFITSPSIYISMIVNNIPAYTDFRTEWKAPDGNSVGFNYTPNFDINGACIWFFIDNSDIPFQVGVWSVDVKMDGEIAGSITFNMINR